MALYCCRRKRWDRSKGHTSNKPLREAICHSDSNGGSLWVEICNGSIGCKVKSTGARVRNASVGRWKVVGSQLEGVDRA
jgi:hypothetical protein